MSCRSIIIDVELIAGTYIKDAAEELCEMANRLSCIITTNFNGYKIYATVRKDPASIILEYTNYCNKRAK